MGSRNWISVHRSVPRQADDPVRWVARWADGMASGIGDTPAAALAAFCELVGEDAGAFEVGVQPAAPQDVTFFRRRTAA